MRTSRKNTQWVEDMAERTEGMGCIRAHVDLHVPRLRFKSGPREKSRDWIPLRGE